jgi:hypothetical protein
LIVILNSLFLTRKDRDHFTLSAMSTLLHCRSSKPDYQQGHSWMESGPHEK